MEINVTKYIAVIGQKRILRLLFLFATMTHPLGVLVR